MSADPAGENGGQGNIQMKNNIVLIGMPGVGKSTIGVILAKELGYQFMDTDLIIQKKENRLLREIIEQEGVDGFLDVENQVNSGIEAERTVIATGGSAVYGREAMKHFREIGTIIYLRLPFEKLRERLGNLRGRGVVLKENKSLRDIFEERSVLYQQYADVIIDEENKDIESTLREILNFCLQIDVDELILSAYTFIFQGCDFSRSGVKSRTPEVKRFFTCCVLRRV